MRLDRFALPLALAALFTLSPHAAENPLPMAERHIGPTAQRDGPLELQCLPVFSPAGEVEGVYVFYINDSDEEFHLRGSRFVPQGLDITVSIPDINELNEYGFSFNPVKSLYHPVIWLNSKVLQGPQTFAMSIKPGEILGKRIVFDDDAKEALRKAKAWQVYVYVRRLFYVLDTNGDGEEDLEPVRISLHRVFYNQKDAKTLLANTCYQKPPTAGEPGEDEGETAAAGECAKEQGETPSKGP